MPPSHNLQTHQLRRTPGVEKPRSGDQKGQDQVGEGWTDSGPVDKTKISEFKLCVCEGNFVLLCTCVSSHVVVLCVRVCVCISNYY